MPSRGPAAGHSAPHAGRRHHPGSGDLRRPGGQVHDRGPADVGGGCGCRGERGRALVRRHRSRPPGGGRSAVSSKRVPSALERLRGSVLAEAVGRGLARVDVVVGPVGLLVAVALVDDRRRRRRCVTQLGDERRLDRRARLPVEVGVDAGRRSARAGCRRRPPAAMARIAPGAVGHGGDPLADLRRGRARRPSMRLSSASRSLSAEPALLARRALPARLDGEEPRHAGHDRHEVVVVVEDDEAGRAEAAADGRQALVAQRVCRAGRR